MSKVMELYKKYLVERDPQQKLKFAKEILDNLLTLQLNPPIWETIRKSTGLKEHEMKEILNYLEEKGEIEIKRAKDGKKLYASTIRSMKRKSKEIPLDMWISRH